MTSNNSTESMSTSKKDKPPCKYGADCYRQNPHHLEQFSHPPKQKRELNTDDASSSAASSSTPSKKIRGHEGEDDDDDDKIELIEVLKPPKAGSLNLVNVGDTRDPEVEAREDLKIRAGGGLSAQPDNFGLHLTKVSGIERRFNQLTGSEGGLPSVGLKDILSEATGDLVESAQFNYMFEVDWLVSQYPASWRKCPLYVVYGVKANQADYDALAEELRAYRQIIASPVKIADLYGTHHTKMMLLHYRQGLRVVIHTANMVENDWHQKTQGVWISPIFPPLEPQSSPPETATPTSSNFKADLLEYLSNYGTPAVNAWMETVRRHNLTSAKVCLVGSVPGRHRDGARSRYGHLKLRRLLAGPFGPPSSRPNWPVIAQFSSVGSLGPDPSKWLCGQFLSSLATVSSSAGSSDALLLPAKPPLKCIYPTVENVRLSLEGYSAGGSLPYSGQVASRQPYLTAFLHQWRANSAGRTHASPHIKSYCRLSPSPSPSEEEDSDRAAWFLLTSANLSKAAWGELQVNGSQLAIRSFELGVLFLPQLLCDCDHFVTKLAAAKGAANFFPLPFDTPLTPYSGGDRHWVVDKQYTEWPDRHGRIWKPDF